MTRSGKSNVLILGVLAIIFACLAAAGFYLEEQERHKGLRLEQQIAQLMKVKQQMEQDLDAAHQEKTHLEEQLSSAQEETKRLASKLTEVSQSMQSQVDERDKKIDGLAKDLEQIQTDREQLTKQLTSVQGQAKKLESQLAQLKKDRSTLETKLNEMKEQSAVELEKVVVKPEAPSVSSGNVPVPQVESTPAGQVITGRVLVVNREYDFVVMNVGKANGVQVGDEFEILRDSKSVGHVKVEKIYEALSAAALQSGTDKQNLREGDTVRSVMKGNS